MVTLDPINVNEPREKRTFTYNEEDIKAIAKEWLEQTQEFEAASGSKFKLFENIVDKDGHKRFIEGDVELFGSVPAGVTKVFGKWSLSGSHLMIVLAGNIANTTVISFSSIAYTSGLPTWILDKIYPIYSNVVAKSDFKVWNDDATSQNITCMLAKTTGLAIVTEGMTASKDRQFRIAFDLLIDNE